LLSTVININHVNNLGWTVLIEEVILGDGGKVYQEIVGLLLAAGADRSIADSNGATPLAHAKARGLTEIAHLLEC
jgi:ankyrin repeat protein